MTVLVLLGSMAMLGGCSLVRTGTSMLEASTPPATTLPLNEAVASLTGALIANAQLGLPSASATYPTVVDPWIDRATGNQSMTTRAMETQIGEVVRDRFPSVELLPFDTESLKRHPLIVIGAINAVSGPGEVEPVPENQAGAYRIWGVIGDLDTGRVISREQAWVRRADVSATPAAFFRDSPAWMPDNATDAYLRTSLASKGEPIDPEYLRGLQVTALLAEGARAYEAGRYQEALSRFTEAERLPTGEQPRVYNGVYLVNRALGQEAPAEAAFGRLVDLGLDRGQVAVKFVFATGSTDFWPDPAVSGPYAVWLRQIAERTAARNTCLVLRGHSSTSGSARANERLSLARAEAVRRLLIRDEPALRMRIRAEGAGSSEPIVGTGVDDVSNVLDRRVDLKPVPCSATAGVVPSAYPAGIPTSASRQPAIGALAER
jgi:outer membrane protein OmpA-like peptidoglycan-associated protein